jgi:hypothetical protein
MTTAAKNGSTPAATIDLPVDTYKDAAPILRRPFTEHAVKFKVQATWTGGALIVCYIDARLVIERLNAVCPHLWFDEYQPIDGNRLLCRLTIDGITRHDIGEGYQGKGLWSDALKRAAVKFGVGVSLYAVPQTFLKEADGHLKAKTVNGKQTYVMTDAGTMRCKQLYAGWLDTVGVHAFGAPLDHGDIENSTGDFEAEPAEVPAASETQPVDKPLTPAAREKIAKAITDAGVDEKLILQSAGFGSLDDITTVSAAVKVRAELDRMVAA